MHRLRKTNSQATAAWGDPSQVILRCGVNVPGPTTDRCVSVNDVDWVIKEGDPVWTLTTFGREPATEILMDPDKISSATVLADLSAAAAKIKASRNCVGQEDRRTCPAASTGSHGLGQSEVRPGARTGPAERQRPSGVRSCGSAPAGSVRRSGPGSSGRKRPTSADTCSSA